MFVEVQRCRRLLYFKTLMMFLTAASMAQGGNGQLPPTAHPMGSFSLKDFKMVDQNFGEARIPTEDKNEIALTLAAVLDHAFGEERSYADAKAGSDRPTSRQRREILDQSSILALAALPNNGHLYIVQIIISSGMPRGPNGEFEIVEASPSGARVLGEGFGWGVAARRRSGLVYPRLTFIASEGAMRSDLENLHYEKGRYVR